MPILVLPQHHQQRSLLHHQLGAYLSAGVGLIESLQMLADSPPARRFRAPLSRVKQRLSEGFTLAEALQMESASFSSLEMALLDSGEKSGRLDVTFKLLSNYFEERARMGRAIITSLLYPLLIVHLAVLVFPPQSLSRLVWEGDVSGFIWEKLILLIPAYALAAVMIKLFQRQGAHTWNSLMETFLHPVPVLGAARRQLALARLSMALEGLTSAGVSIIEAWKLAAQSSGSPALSRCVQRWKPDLAAGRTPAEMVRSSRCFPEVFAQLYATGETTGQLDETLHRLHLHYQEEGMRKLQALAQWIPRLIYILILIAIGYMVVRFWVSYYSNIVDAF
jgi:type II secretory pathway component PulF